MSANVQHAITELEQELEATQQRCHLIERAIAGLREIYGDASPRAQHRRQKTERNGTERSKTRASDTEPP